MKKFMIAGGLLGFLIGLVFGLVQQSSWPSVLWKASVATFCAGLLFRWWAGVWVESIYAVRLQKAAAEAKLADSEATVAPSKP